MDDLESTILEVARRYYDRGPGFAQESVVLREIAARLSADSLAEQQQILTCWHRLFQQGKLSWGYDLDNPNRPFFHFPALVESASN